MKKIKKKEMEFLRKNIEGIINQLIGVLDENAGPFDISVLKGKDLASAILSPEDWEGIQVSGVKVWPGFAVEFDINSDIKEFFVVLNSNKSFSYISVENESEDWTILEREYLDP